MLLPPLENLATHKAQMQVGREVGMIKRAPVHRNNASPLFAVINQCLSISLELSSKQSHTLYILCFKGISLVDARSAVIKKHC